MSFANPMALWGLLFLLVPLVVHLYSFRTVRRVAFSNLSFLKEIKEESKRASRLKHLLLLMSRLLAILFLVAAFARPQWGSTAPSLPAGSGYHSVFIDNSMSMTLSGTEGVLLEQAKTAAREMAKASRPDDLFQLLTHESAPISQRWLEREAFVSAVDGVQPVSRASSLEAIVERQQALVSYSGDGARTRYYYLSDFQLPVANPATLKISKSEGRVHLLQVRAEETPNVFIDSCWLLQPLLRPRQPARLVFRLRNGGTADVNTVRVSLRINQVQKGLASVDLPAGASFTDTIDFTPESAGTFQAMLEIDESYFSSDNQWYMSFRVQEQLRLLHLRGRQAGPFIRALFENDDFIDYQTADLQRLDFNALRNFEAIVLEAPDEVSSGLVNALQHLVALGASVVVIPAAKNPTELQPLLTALEAGSLGGALSEAQGVRRLALDDKLFQETFRYLPEQLSLPRSSRYLAYDARPDDRVLMRLGNEAPWLIRRTYGQGSLLVLLSALDDEWTDFQRHALFVPVFYRAALLGGDHGPLSYRLGADDRLTLPAGLQPAAGELVSLKRGQESYIPEIRRLGMQITLDLSSATLQPGHYDLHVSGRRVDNFLVAFNSASSESVFDYLSAADLQKLSAERDWESFEVNKAALAGTLLWGEKAENSWRWFLILVLVFLFAETLIIKIFP
jgi:hypothetical protein